MTTTMIRLCFVDRRRRHERRTHHHHYQPSLSPSLSPSFINRPLSRSLTSSSLLSLCPIYYSFSSILLLIFFNYQLLIPRSVTYDRRILFQLSDQSIERSDLLLRHFWFPIVNVCAPQSVRLLPLCVSLPACISLLCIV